MLNNKKHRDIYGFCKQVKLNLKTFRYTSQKYKVMHVFINPVFITSEGQSGRVRAFFGFLHTQNIMVSHPHMSTCRQKVNQKLILVLVPAERIPSGEENILAGFGT